MYFAQRWLAKDHRIAILKELTGHTF